MPQTDLSRIAFTQSNGNRGSVEGGANIVHGIVQRYRAGQIDNLEFSSPALEHKFQSALQNAEDADEDDDEPDPTTNTQYTGQALILNSQQRHDAAMADFLRNAESTVPEPILLGSHDDFPGYADPASYLPPAPQPHPRSATTMTGNRVEASVLTNEQREFLESVVPLPCLVNE